MTELQDITSVLTAGGIIATAIITFGIWHYTRKDRLPIFGKFQRKNYNDGSWIIFLHSPSKPIGKCNVTFRGKPIPIQNTNNYEKSMALGEAGVFLMPSNISSDDDGMIIVRDGKNNIIKEKFNTIPMDLT